MMPTVGRLKTRPQFLKVAAARRKWVTPGLVLQAARRTNGEARAAPELPSEPVEELAGKPVKRDALAMPDTAEPEVRVGFTVTRKVGNAVIRNRAKRRLRAAAAEVFPRLGRSGTDYVVIGRSGTLTRPYDALRGDLEQAILKLERPGSGNGGHRAGGRASPKEASR
jgi:ribonuclease P protein component